MEVVGWKLRLRVFLERLWQPTTACMTCMTAPSFVNLVSAVHWKIALQTGVVTGILALLLTLTPLGKLFGQRYGNALLVGLLTALADAWSHPGRFGFEKEVAKRMEWWASRKSAELGTDPPRETPRDS